VGSEHQRCREGSEAIAASSHERAAHGKEILEPLCQPIWFLPHLYRLSANPSHSLMLIRPQPLLALRAALCCRRLGPVGFLGMP